MDISAKKSEENTNASDADFKEPTGIPGTEKSDIPEYGPKPEPELKPKPKKNIFKSLFNPETRFGRGMRSSTRWVGIILGLFALGMLATYFLLVQPLSASLDQTQAALEKNTQELQTANQKIADLQANQKTDNSSLQTALVQLNFMKLKANVEEAQLGLARKEDAAVKVAMDKIAVNLPALLPELKKIDANKAALLETRMNEALADMKTDPLLVQTDLERSTSTLLELEMILFK